MTILIVTLVVVVAVIYILYAGIIKKRNKVYEALSGIDVQLKQRSSLIPNVLAIAKKFMEHEMTVFTEVTKLRESLGQDYDKSNPSDVSIHLGMANALSDKLAQLKVTMENYPQIKSDATMVQAMQTYNEVEANLAAARRFYNSSVTELNNAVQIFPGSVIAPMIHISSMPFFETDQASRAEVGADGRI